MVNVNIAEPNDMVIYEEHLEDTTVVNQAKGNEYDPDEDEDEEDEKDDEDDEDNEMEIQDLNIAATFGN